jgi:tetratricopeptide (TPR) repeat protein
MSLFRDNREVEATKPAREALRIREALLGDNHPDTIASLRLLATIYYQADKAGAEALFRRALKASEAVNGPSHRDTLLTLRTLGSLLMGDRPREAEPMLTRTFQGFESANGLVDSDTRMSAELLAAFYLANRRLEDAFTLLTRVFEAHEREQGFLAPETSRLASTLSEFYHSVGRFDAAESLARRGMKEHEQQFGTNHFATTEWMIFLAANLSRQRRCSEAIPLLQRAVVNLSSAGANHPTLLLAEENLGVCYANEKESSRSEELLRKVLLTREQTLGPEHIDTVRVREHLAYLFIADGNTSQVEALLSPYIFKGKRGDTVNPSIISTIVNLYMSNKRYDEVVEIMTAQMPHLTKGFEAGAGGSTNLVAAYLFSSLSGGSSPSEALKISRLLASGLRARTF